MFSLGLATHATRPPARSTRLASSVPTKPSSSAARCAASTSWARKTCGVCTAQKRERSGVELDDAIHAYDLEGVGAGIRPDGASKGLVETRTRSMAAWMVARWMRGHAPVMDGDEARSSRAARMPARPAAGASARPPRRSPACRARPARRPRPLSATQPAGHTTTICATEGASAKAATEPVEHGQAAQLDVLLSRGVARSGGQGHRPR